MGFECKTYLSFVCPWLGLGSSCQALTIHTLVQAGLEEKVTACQWARVAEPFMPPREEGLGSRGWVCRAFAWRLLGCGHLVEDLLFRVLRVAAHLT